jgi:hypothetical protein
MSIVGYDKNHVQLEISPDSPCYVGKGGIEKYDMTDGEDTAKSEPGPRGFCLSDTLAVIPYHWLQTAPGAKLTTRAEFKEADFALIAIEGRKGLLPSWFHFSTLTGNVEFEWDVQGNKISGPGSILTKAGCDFQVMEFEQELLRGDSGLVVEGVRKNVTDTSCTSIKQQIVRCDLHTPVIMIIARSRTNTNLGLGLRVADFFLLGCRGLRCNIASATVLAYPRH